VTPSESRLAVRTLGERLCAKLYSCITRSAGLTGAGRSSHVQNPDRVVMSRPGMTVCHPKPETQVREAGMILGRWRVLNEIF
jgi:hypothetical protein